MGHKSRGCYSVGVCLRGECVNHSSSVCDKCLHFSLYERFNFTDAYKQPIKIDGRDKSPDGL